MAIVTLLMLNGGLPPAFGRRSLSAGPANAHLRADSLLETNITVGTNPVGIVYNPSNQEVYVANSGSNTTSAIKSSGGTPVTIKVGHDPQQLVYDPADKDVYVRNEVSSTVSVINGSNKVAHTLRLPGSYPGFFLADPANGNVYTFEYNLSVPTLWDLNHSTWKVRGIPLGSSPSCLVFDNATNDLVLCESTPNDLQIVAPNDSVTTVHLSRGLAPSSAAYDPVDNDVLVTDLGSNSMGVTATGNVTVLDSSNTIVKTLKVPAAPELSAYDPADQDMFVLGLGKVPSITTNLTVTVLTPGLAVAKTLVLGKDCGLPTYEPTNREMYVPCLRSNETFVLNSTTLKLTAKLATGGNPQVALYDPAAAETMVFNDPVFYGYNLTIRTLAFAIPSSNAGISKLTLGTGSTGGEIYDPNDSAVWVTNIGSGTVTVIS